MDHSRTASHMRHAGRSLAGLVRHNAWTVVILVAVVVFVGLLQEVLEGEAIRLDAMAYQLVVVRMRSAWLTPVMQSISELALPVVLVVLLLAVEAFAPGRRPGVCAAVNLTLVLALNQVLKQIVHRPRPEGFRLIAESGYSFPSGHSMVAMAFYGLLAWMVWHYEKDRVVRWVCCLGFSLVVVAIGLSRVYLGVHYATDVIAGFCVSLAWLGLYTKVFVPVFMGETPTDSGLPPRQGV
ncbi:phosphatase PAP2 family protein [Olsenella sp. HMSC062G07]|uniref:phosphatase PAP2 family protein n=1 Tax=Olsenella sp. HMSC062G07 TaxID=1739330 RepID=UPI000AD075EF|nr:phosphatase PAP2 family protein [Olsenella sp. HMSC062G07]